MPVLEPMMTGDHKPAAQSDCRTPVLNPRKTSTSRRGEGNSLSDFLLINPNTAVQTELWGRVQITLLEQQAPVHS